jgi:aminoglycoside phosphotransferase (APT) family kinase protein
MPMSQLPLSTDAEKAIRRTLLGMFGPGTTVVAVETYAYETSFPLYRAEIEKSGKRFGLVIKDSGRSRASAAMSGKPEFLYHPLREVLVYREILSALGSGVPRYYGSAHDERLDHVYLILEHVQGRELWQVGDFSSWLQVAARLARQHAILRRFLFSPQCHDIPLVEYSERMANAWLGRANRFTSSMPRVTKLLAAASRILTTHGRDFYSQPPTIVHGDFYPANLLLRDVAVEATHLCVIDWEIAGRGPGLLDLAALIAGKWTADERRELATAYYEGMPQTSDIRQDRQQFDRQLAHARLQTAIRWLGWSQSWQPPAQQRNDWGAELEGSLQELGATAAGN